jgi:hypothetical protein
MKLGLKLFGLTALVLMITERKAIVCEYHKQSLAHRFNGKKVPTSAEREAITAFLRMVFP